VFENPDFVRLSLYNYRWYLGMESGDRKYDELEKKITTFPTIACPTITLDGDANGAPHADPSVYAKKYVGRYEHRNIAGGIGHNLPQEAPEALPRPSLMSTLPSIVPNLELGKGIRPNRAEL
jgi:hypothetical protein